ncbi:hypothetical protein DID77_00090 [Candidatus Marinamargulisbacteria bacterium SCGC AG-439-L15]|nr:hypothetical protein DID77_00090 [Candidatus Marinamargulisbacteria bacterium SCGC AG-439-L15]
MNIQGPEAGNIQQSMNVSSSKADATMQKLEDAILSLMDLTKEVAESGRTSALSKQDTGKKTEDTGTQPQTVGQEQTQQTQQVASQREAQNEQGNQEGTPEGAALAGLLSEDEMEIKKKKNRKLEFEKKMEKLYQLESELADVEFEEPSHQEALEQFFQNMGTIKKRQEHMKRLEHQEEKLQEQLDKQEKATGKVAEIETPPKKEDTDRSFEESNLPQVKVQFVDPEEEREKQRKKREREKQQEQERIEKIKKEGPLSSGPSIDQVLGDENG